MPLQDGKYYPAIQKRVTVWKAPDKDGDGPEVWKDRVSSGGESMGRFRETDTAGNVLHEYNAPDGFHNFPSFDHTDHWLRVDERGRPYRNPNGECIEIQPGSVLVEHADGTAELIADEYQQYLFEISHEHDDSAGDVELPSEALINRVAAEDADAEIADLEKALADKKAARDDASGTKKSAVTPEAKSVTEEKSTPAKATPATVKKTEVK